MESPPILTPPTDHPTDMTHYDDEEELLPLDIGQSENVMTPDLSEDHPPTETTTSVIPSSDPPPTETTTSVMASSPSPPTPVPVVTDPPPKSFYDEWKFKSEVFHQRSFWTLDILNYPQSSVLFQLEPDIPKMHPREDIDEKFLEIPESAKERPVTLRCRLELISKNPTTKEVKFISHTGCTKGLCKNFGRFFVHWNYRCEWNAQLFYPPFKVSLLCSGEHLGLSSECTLYLGFSLIDSTGAQVVRYYFPTTHPELQCTETQKHKDLQYYLYMDDPPSGKGKGKGQQRGTRKRKQGSETSVKQKSSAATANGHQVMSAEQQLQFDKNHKHRLDTVYWNTILKQFASEVIVVPPTISKLGSVLYFILEPKEQSKKNGKTTDQVPKGEIVIHTITIHAENNLELLSDCRWVDMGGCYCVLVDPLPLRNTPHAVWLIICASEERYYKAWLQVGTMNQYAQELGEIQIEVT